MAKTTKNKFSMPRIMEKKYMGNEPKNYNFKNDKNTIPYQIALTYFNYFYTYQEARIFLKEYLKTPQLNSKIDKYTDLSLTACWIAKMKMNGCILSDSSEAYLKNKIDEIKNWEPPTENKLDTDKIPEEMYLIQEINDLISGKHKKRLIAYMQNEEISSYVKKIVNHFKKVDIDPEYLDIIQNTVNIPEKPKIERKPRVKKTIPVEKLIGLIRTQSKSDEIGMVTIEPKKILASEMLVMYNTKNKTLSLLYAKDKKFTVHRTAITGIDSTKSYTKKIRKPIEISKYLSGTRKSIERVIKELKTTEYPVDKFTTNEYTMILKNY